MEMTSPLWKLAGSEAPEEMVAVAMHLLFFLGPSILISFSRE